MAAQGGGAGGTTFATLYPTQDEYQPQMQQQAQAPVPDLYPTYAPPVNVQPAAYPQAGK